VATIVLNLACLIRHVVAVLLFTTFMSSAFAGIIDCQDWKQVRRAVDQSAKKVSGTVQEESGSILLIRIPDINFVLIAPINASTGACIGVILLWQWELDQPFTLENYVKVQKKLYPAKIRNTNETKPSETEVSLGIVMMGGMSDEIFMVNFETFLQKIRDLTTTHGRK